MCCESLSHACHASAISQKSSQGNGTAPLFSAAADFGFLHNGDSSDEGTHPLSRAGTDVLQPCHRGVYRLISGTPVV